MEERKREWVVMCWRGMTKLDPIILLICAYVQYQSSLLTKIALQTRVFGCVHKIVGVGCKDMSTLLHLWFLFLLLE